MWGRLSTCGRLSIGLSVLCPLVAAAPPTFQLPNTITPRRHTVELTIDPARETFEGHIQIEVDLRVPSTEIWVNGKNLTISSATIVTPAGTLTPTVLTAAGEFIGLSLLVPLEGPATLDYRYQGRLDEKGLAGAYRRKSAAPGGASGDWYVFTTFTPIDARRAFPCFDEPRFKTPWSISIRTREGDRALSNGRELTVTGEPDGWKLTTFAETAPLPAEVVAFAVGPFDVLDGGTSGAATPIRVITAKGHASEGQAAARATAAVLPRLEAYTGIPYPYGKLDHIALPEESFGAVENPGLITYRSEGLLTPPGQNNPAKERAIRRLQAHEIAHQWFGNLVTQADWQDVWLSEGFATWLGTKVMDEEEPPERAHLAAILARERIMNADASPRTRPVRFRIGSREDALGVYDRMVYDKAAAVLLMLEAWIGEDKFREGLRAYLAAHRFGSASADDLALELAGAAGINPALVMHSLLDSTGVPAIHLQADCARRKLRITSTAAGPIPVCWRTDSAQRCAVAAAPSAEVELASCPAWLFPNSGGTGYYRTTWSPQQLAALPLDRLSAAERLTLVYDLKTQREIRSAAGILKRLSNDSQPEIAAAARIALK